MTIGNSVTNIGNSAFRDCSSLTSVTIPNSVTSIGNSAFYNCSNLTSVTIGNSVASIGDYAFYGTAWDGNLPNGLIYAGKVAYKYKGTMPSNTSITLQEGTLGIAGSAFYDCSGLTSVIIPNSVTNIGYKAFSGCSSLTSVTIPNSVTSIDYGAFSGCSGLTSVTVEMETPIVISSYTFYNRANVTLYVPYGCKAEYEAADYWKEFKEIVEMEPEQIEANDVLAAVDAEGMAGKQATLEVALTNEDEVKLCQFDLRLPAGVTVATKSNGKLDAQLTERAETHSVSSNKLDNGDYRFIISSMDNDSFTGNNGTLVKITIDIADTMEDGDYTVKVLNAEVSVPDGNDLRVVKPKDTESKLTVKTYTPGDVNNDGLVSVTDVGCVINYILEQVPTVFIEAAADMNQDNSISVTDVGIIINYILTDGATSRSIVGNASERCEVVGNASERYTSSISLSSLGTLGSVPHYVLSLSTPEAFTAFQMDIAAADCEVSLTTDAAESHLMTSRRLGDGRYRVVCYSPTNEPLPATTTELLDIATAGDIAVSDIRFTTNTLEEVRFADISAMTTGIADIRLPRTFKVFTLDGCLYREVTATSLNEAVRMLQPGIYLIDNRKCVVR